MDFKDLQKELFERKFNVLEYFMWMFRILRVFIWENKLWVTGFVLSNILIGIMPADFVKKYWFMSTVLVYYGRIFIFISYAKVLHRIESTENEYKFTNLIVKYLKLLLVLIFSVPLLLVLIKQLKFVTKIITKNQILNGQIIGMVFVVLSLIFIPYFTQIYAGRNMKMWQSLKYNFMLARKSRLRVAIPIIILAVLNNLLLMMNYYHNNFGQLYARNIVTSFVMVISSIFQIVIVIMYVIVFLNVEYDYLKSHRKDTEKMIENEI